MIAKTATKKYIRTIRRHPSKEGEPRTRTNEKNEAVFGPPG
jgi:hypothetical protein